LEESGMIYVLASMFEDESAADWTRYKRQQSLQPKPYDSHPRAVNANSVTDFLMNLGR